MGSPDLDLPRPLKAASGGNHKKVKIGLFLNGRFLAFLVQMAGQTQVTMNFYFSSNT